MAKRHAWRGIAHDRLDPCLRIAALAVRTAILTVELVSMRAGSRPIERLLNRFTAFNAHSAFILQNARVITGAIDLPYSLQRSPILFDFVHALISFDPMIRNAGSPFVGKVSQNTAEIERPFSAIAYMGMKRPPTRTDTRC